MQEKCDFATIIIIFFKFTYTTALGLKLHEKDLHLLRTLLVLLKYCLKTFFVI